MMMRSWLTATTLLVCMSCESRPDLPDAGSGSHEICDRYLACVAVTTPNGLPALQQGYGQNGTCWRGTAVEAQQCLQACAVALSQSRQAFVDKTECACRADSECLEKDLHVCDTITGRCQACNKSSQCAAGKSCYSPVGDEAVCKECGQTSLGCSPLVDPVSCNAVVACIDNSPTECPGNATCCSQSRCPDAKGYWQCLREKCKCAAESTQCIECSKLNCKAAFQSCLATCK
jgi:hypothetical protein